MSRLSEEYMLSACSIVVEEIGVANTLLIKSLLVTESNLLEESIQSHYTGTSKRNFSLTNVDVIKKGYLIWHEYFSDILRSSKKGERTVFQTFQMILFHLSSQKTIEIDKCSLIQKAGENLMLQYLSMSQMKRIEMKKISSFYREDKGTQSDLMKKLKDCWAGKVVSKRFKR